jgi:hypothetical protein
MRKYRKRIHYTETDKALMWDRWRKGDSLEKIAQLFGRTHSSVACIFRRTGRIRPPVSKFAQVSYVFDRSIEESGGVCSTGKSATKDRQTSTTSAVCRTWYIFHLLSPGSTLHI